jgi:DNA repair exonuclease SbcCD ATPase subunit
MADASVGVTVERVRTFLEEYLEAVGAEIKETSEEGVRYSFPNIGDDTHPLEEFSEAVFEQDVDGEGAVALGPETEYLSKVLKEASQQQRFGKVDISEATETDVPPWARESGLDVKEYEFVPYYDRVAIVPVFSVSVETVSEYETEFLRTLALDVRNKEVLDGVEMALLEATGGMDPEPSNVSVENTDVEGIVEKARQKVTEELMPEINKIRDNASKSAAVEMEEYRNLQRERLEEKREEAQKVREKIEDVTEVIESTEERKERLEALREKENLGQRLEELNDEIDEIETKTSEDYPEKHEEVYRRHSVNVRIETASVTVVSYEKGELSIRFTQGKETMTKKFDYATGAGVTEEVLCEDCGRELSVDRPLGSAEPFVCDRC